MLWKKVSVSEERKEEMDINQMQIDINLEDRAI